MIVEKDSSEQRNGSQSMKKVLIVTYPFPPNLAAGANRAVGLAKYLPEFRWEPVVLTAALEGEERNTLKNQMSVVEAQSFDMMRFLRNPFSLGNTKPSASDRRIVVTETPSTRSYLKHLTRAIATFPDRHNFWWFGATRQAKKIIKTHKFDCIISTSPPWTTALVANSLSSATGVPFIADLRDLWSHYHRYEFGKLRHSLDRWLERRTLSRAEALVVVSDMRAEKLKTILPDKQIECITLGFDPEDFSVFQISPRKDVFTITHAGKLKGKQDAKPVFRAIAELIEEEVIPRDRIEAHFWGPVETDQKQDASERGLDGTVIFHDLISRREVIQRELESHVLLLFSWNDPDELGIHPGKLFDYLGARRPILAVGEYRDVVANVIGETKTGLHLKTVDELKCYFRDAYRSFQSQGAAPYQPDDTAISRYSYREIAGKFARLMDSIGSRANGNSTTADSR